MEVTGPVLEYDSLQSANDRETVPILSVSPVLEDHRILEDILSSRLWTIKRALTLRRARHLLERNPFAVVVCEGEIEPGMWQDLLKKTGAGNLFMVFGEPDVDIRPVGANQIEIEIRGLDVYDPTTQEIRSRSTDDIACWFIDTDYNGESFFVRHAYFTGADEPYEKLKRALRADVDESAWSGLYSTVSRPFLKPKGKGKAPGKIAIKVINHYGDEVLKVYPV